VDEHGRRRRQLAVFLAGVLLLNFPVLGLVDAIRLPGGAPLTPLYLFSAWLGAILVTAALVRPRRRDG
jgi:hypothetical protein